MKLCRFNFTLFPTAYIHCFFSLMTEKTEIQPTSTRHKKLTKTREPFAARASEPTNSKTPRKLQLQLTLFTTSTGWPEHLPSYQLGNQPKASFPLAGEGLQSAHAKSETEENGRKTKNVTVAFDPRIGHLLKEWVPSNSQYSVKLWKKSQVSWLLQA